MSNYSANMSINCTDGIRFDTLDIVNAVLIFGMFFGLGMACDVKDLAEVYRRPTGMLIIMAGQFILMPFLAWVFSLAGSFEPAFAVALVMSCTAPGGSTSNILAAIFQSDVPLSVGATALSSVLAIGVMPLNQYIYVVGARLLSEEANVCFTFYGVLFSASLVVVAVAAGLFLKPVLQRKGMYGTIKAVYVLTTVDAAVMVILGVAVNQYSGMPFQQMPNFGVKFICIVLPNVIGSLFGWFAAKCLKFNGPSMLTCSLEIGVHNKHIAIASLMFMFDDDIAAQVIAVPILFSLWAMIFNTVWSIVAWKLGYTNLPKDKSLCQALVLYHKSNTAKRNVDVYGTAGAPPTAKVVDTGAVTIGNVDMTESGEKPATAEVK